MTRVCLWPMALKTNESKAEGIALCCRLMTVSEASRQRGPKHLTTQGHCSLSGTRTPKKTQEQRLLRPSQPPRAHQQGKSGFPLPVRFSPFSPTGTLTTWCLCKSASKASMRWQVPGPLPATEAPLICRIINPWHVLAAAFPSPGREVSHLQERGC